jgi:hypothetical protein
MLPGTKMTSETKKEEEVNPGKLFKIKIQEPKT